ncbi:hypothetical protein [Bifidobacterium olomucense]|uniref:Uncharacterized protein n=1 Tax=Bifidobacterium olomucense TaxID=2675324 RepID=A0A7Y0EW62_9BIFI|nr:hypothetical protein [Bifidobacterium sp. DSM 109959]NMM97537.1 hypothetical protein [Bifidobacterium sp. DSM 109959]
MRAHRKNGTGEYVPCRAKSADACPYGAYQHREFENGTALMQYNTIEGTGHDWGELQARYPSLFEPLQLPENVKAVASWNPRLVEAAYPPDHSEQLEALMMGSSVDQRVINLAVEKIVADDSVAAERDVIASMDWTDPDATFSAIAGRMEERSIHAYAYGAGVNATGIPVEMVKEDLPVAYKNAKAAQYVKDYLGRDRDYYAGAVQDTIAADPGLARSVALAIGRASGDLVPPEDAELPAASVRVFDGQVRAEAVREYPGAAAQYADSLRSIADGLETAMKRSKGLRRYSRGTVITTAVGRLLTWRDVPDDVKARIEQTIQGLRSAADEVQGNAALDMSDAGNAAKTATTLRNADRLAWDAGKYRSDIGRDGGANDEAFSTATSRSESARSVLGSTIRRTQGLRGYYAAPVPGTDPITTENEAACLEALSKVPQQDHGRYDAPPRTRTEASAFLQDYGVTALRPDGTIETDPLTAVRRSVTRRLTSDKYEGMLGRSRGTEAESLHDRLGDLPRTPAKQAGQEPSGEALSRASVLSRIITD